MMELENPRAIAQEISLRPVEIKGELIESEGSQPPAPHSFIRRHGLFIVTFVAPVVIAAIYLFLIAADRYVSEAKFIIRSSTSNYDNVSALVESRGLSRATEETYAVNEYVLSRDALELLVAQKNYRGILASTDGDMINRFPNFYSRDNNEELFKAYKRMVTAYVDGGSGISTLEVVAFRPEDTRMVATALLGYAEEFINRLNARAYRDALSYADHIVELAHDGFAKAQARLTAYRNSSGMVDTTRESASALDSIAKLSAELAEIEATIAQQQSLAPSNPGLPTLREKARSYRDEINQQKLRLVGEDSSMSTKLGMFERLVLEREIAAKSLASAEHNRDQARHDAEQQHLYLQVIVAPNLPDVAKYPRRFLYFFMTIAGAAAVYVCCRAFVESVREHVS